MTEISQFLDKFPIAANLIITSVLVLAINLLSYRILAALAKWSYQKNYLWTQAVLQSLKAPLQGLFWVITVTVVVQIFGLAQKKSLINDSFEPIRDVITLLLFMWFFMRLVSRGCLVLRTHAQAKNRPLDATASDAIAKLLQACIVILALLMIMAALDFSISSLIAFGGVGGIAIGFAAQSLVANLLGGITVYISKPFKVGEFIIMPNNGVQGKVQEIGWRATKVLGFDRRPFYVPNALFNTAVLINHTRMSNRRIQEHLMVGYSDIGKVHHIIEQGNQMLGDHAEIEHDFFVFRFDTCGDFAVKLYIYAFTQTTDYSEFMRIKEDVLFKIIDIIHKNGAKLAVPASRLYAPQGIEIKSLAQPDPQCAGVVDQPQAPNANKP